MIASYNRQSYHVPENQDLSGRLLWAPLHNGVLRPVPVACREQVVEALRRGAREVKL